MNTADPTTLLNQLRDIHLPEPIGWWPLAMGWWLVIAATCFILLGIGYYYWHKRYPSTLRIALTLLTKLQQRQMQQPDQNYLAELSIIIRRVALTRFPRSDVAYLHNDAWLRFLDHTGKTTAFTQGPGQCLAQGPYRQHTDINWSAVFSCVTQWMKTIYA